MNKTARKIGACLIVGTSILLLTLQSLHASPVVDQEHVPINDFGGLEITANQSVGQTFTVGINGTLSEVVITQIRHHRCVATDDLIFELYETVGGVPVGIPIASGFVPASSVPALFGPFGPVSFSVLPPFTVQVAIGDVLAIKLITAAPGGGCTFAWNGEVVTPTATYTGGHTLLFFGGGTTATISVIRDMAFRTLVEPPVNHYKCYRVNGAQSTPRRVTLEDQFGVEDVRVRKLVSICNPVDKNGEGISNPTAHLACYEIKGRKPSRREVLVENQFGAETVTVSKPEVLCVPSSKTEL